MAFEMLRWVRVPKPSNGSQETQEKPIQTRRAISAPLRRAVWVRDQGRCQYQDPYSKKFCHSTRALQIDHIHPIAMGGKSDISNLRLLCFSHNQFQAILTFGLPKIARYVRFLK